MHEPDVGRQRRQRAQATTAPGKGTGDHADPSQRHITHGLAWDKDEKKSEISRGRARCLSFSTSGLGPVSHPGRGQRRPARSPVWSEIPGGTCLSVVCLVGIGTLHEGALHAAFKQWLARPGDLFEQPVGRYVVDVVRGDLLIEIQTGGFSPLREKLPRLLENHRVRLVAPVARSRTIVRLDDEGLALSRRRSPQTGRIEDIFARLVSIAALVAHAGFELEVVEIKETEKRVHQPGRAWRRKGWVVQGRELDDVVERNLIRGPADLAALLPDSLPAVFSTADIARRGGLPRATAQQMAFCLCAAGALTRVGKRGNAGLFQRVV